MWSLLFLLLPIAALSGWYFGYRQRDHISIESTGNNKQELQKDYFIGLNYLINEQPDKAVDVFIKALVVDSDTVEMHLALGSLFRRRGEVDRAIKIHQNLIARPQLTKEQRNNAISELAQDYLRAGVLDRAERLFLELTDLKKDDEVNYKFLSSIYEKQKDWRQAISATQKLSSSKSEAMKAAIGYYYCELAEEVLQQGLTRQAETYLKKALHEDSDCVRANILLGKMAQNSGDYKSAVHFYQQIREQDAEFLSEVAPLLATCYEQLNNVDDLLSFLQESLQKTHNVSLALFLAKYIEKTKDTSAAIAFIAEQSKYSISLRTLEYLISLYRQNISHSANSENTEAIAKVNNEDTLNLILNLCNKLLENKPFYSCANCGLRTKQLYWQCPGCKKFVVIKPIKNFV